MANFIIIRPVHVLRGREEEALRWAKSTEVVRRRHGMSHQWTVRNIIDPSETLLIQVWESREAYEAWRKSEEREKLVAERARFIAYDPTRHFQEM